MGESAYTQLCGPLATQDHLPNTVSQDLMHPRLDLFPRVVKGSPWESNPHPAGPQGCQSDLRANAQDFRPEESGFHLKESGFHLARNKKSVGFRPSTHSGLSFWRRDLAMGFGRRRRMFA